MFKENFLVFKKGHESAPAFGEADESKEQDLAAITPGQLEEYLLQDFYGHKSDSLITEDLAIAQLFQETVDQAKTRYKRGDRLISKEGIRWTWIDNSYRKSTEIVPIYLEHPEIFDESIQQLVKEYQDALAKKEEAEKEKLKERRAEAGKLDQVTLDITEIGTALIEAYGFDRVSPLDEKAIDDLVKKGYVEVSVLFDSDTKEEIGFTLKNPKTGDKREFVLVSEEVEEAEEKEPLEKITFRDANDLYYASREALPTRENFEEWKSKRFQIAKQMVADRPELVALLEKVEEGIKKAQDLALSTGVPLAVTKDDPSTGLQESLHSTHVLDFSVEETGLIQDIIRSAYEAWEKLYPSEEYFRPDGSIHPVDE